jgi:hypothetical protein
MHEREPLTGKHEKENGCCHYKRILWIINAITGILGAAMIGLGAYMIRNPAAGAMLPSWTMKLSIVFGVLIFLISFLGCWGTYVAEEKKLHKEYNWWLWSYCGIVFIAFIVQVAVAVALVNVSGLIKDANTSQTINKGSSAAAQSFENGLVKGFTANPKAWIDIQNQFHCCGYNSTSGNLATGAACGVAETTTVVQCKSRVLDWGSSHLVSMIALSVLLAIVDFAAFVSSCGVLCRPAKGTGYHSIH